MRKALSLIVMVLMLSPGLANGQVKHGELPDWMKKRVRKGESSGPQTPAKSTNPGGSSETVTPGLEELYPVENELSPEEVVEERAFTMGTLISSRYVKPASGAHKIRFGVNSRIAPVRAVTKSQLDTYTNSYPEMEQVVDLASEVDLDAVRRSSPDEVRAQFLAIDGLSDEEKSAIESVDFASQQEAVSTLIEVVNDPEEAITFSIEPYLSANFDLFAFSVFVPLAGFSHGDDASFEMGNLTLDGRFGHYEDLPGAKVGFSYGLSLSAPTGTSRADSIALSNLLDSPRYRHAYLGLEPYIAFGMDAKYVIIQMEGGITTLSRVREDNSPPSMTYFRYGGAFSLVPFEVIALTVELSGGANMSDASAFNLMQLTGSLRFRVLDTVEPAIAVQTPLALPGREEYGETGDLAFGSPADINVFAGLSVAF